MTRPSKGPHDIYAHPERAGTVAVPRGPSGRNGAKHRQGGRLDEGEAGIVTAYVGILEKDPSSLWGVWFPDLPGCIAAAETADATVIQAAEALAQWMALIAEDGRTLPPARTIEVLREDVDVSQALAAGHAAVVIRPPFDELGFDESAIKAIDSAAERRGLSRRDLVREMVLNQIAV